MLCNTVDPNFGNKFKRFLSLENGRGNSSDLRENWVTRSIQRLKKLLEGLKNKPDTSKPTDLETETDTKSSKSLGPKDFETTGIDMELSKSLQPEEIMAAILEEIQEPCPNIIRLGVAIGYMEIYLARGYCSEEAIKRRIAEINRWFNHVTNRQTDLAFSLGEGQVFVFNEDIKKIAKLKSSEDSCTYYLIVTGGYVRITFYRGEKDNLLKMQLFGCSSEEEKNHFGKKLNELNKALQELQSASSKSQNK